MTSPRVVLVEIWINPACSKCRTATEAFDAADIDYTVRRYLDDPPTADEFAAVLERMDLDPWHVVRMTESAATELADVPKDAGHRQQWIDTMVAHPILIQRPIVTADDGTTVVGRDPESLARVIDGEGG